MGFEDRGHTTANVYLVAPVDPNAPQDDAKDDLPFDDITLVAVK